LGEHWIQFAWNQRAIGYVVAEIARGFQLARAMNPFFKQCSLIVACRRARFRVRTDQGRMRYWDSASLQTASGVCEAAADTWIAHTGILVTAIRSRERSGRTT